MSLRIEEVLSRMREEATNQHSLNPNSNAYHDPTFIDVRRFTYSSSTYTPSIQRMRRKMKNIISHRILLN